MTVVHQYPLRRAYAFSSRVVLLLALATAAGSTARAADNGYLGLSLGSARADFGSGSPSGGSSQLQARFAGARQLSELIALELGVSFAKGFAPPTAVAARYPGSYIKAVVVDGSALFRVPVTPSTRLFLAAGPAMTSARIEVGNTRGRSTKIKSHRDFTLRFGAGVDFMRDQTTIRLAFEHLPAVGTDVPGSTGRSALDTVSIGILLRF